MKNPGESFKNRLNQTEERMCQLEERFFKKNYPLRGEKK